MTVFLVLIDRKRELRREFALWDKAIRNSASASIKRTPTAVRLELPASPHDHAD